VRVKAAAAVLMLAAGLLVSGCGDDKPVGKATEASEDTVKKDCADPKWKEANLGLWYSVCRQPLRW
jgi:hypothetical protein